MAWALQQSGHERTTTGLASHDPEHCRVDGWASQGRNGRARLKSQRFRLPIDGSRQECRSQDGNRGYGRADAGRLARAGTRQCVAAHAARDQRRPARRFGAGRKRGKRGSGDARGSGGRLADDWRARCDELANDGDFRGGCATSAAREPDRRVASSGPRGRDGYRGHRGRRRKRGRGCGRRIGPIGSREPRGAGRSAAAVERRARRGSADRRQCSRPQFAKHRGQTPRRRGDERVGRDRPRRRQSGTARGPSGRRCVQ